ncbi:MAG: NYN domain-containing protein [Actinomycetota bacterium]|nr:NYN domain-containing protein [Actinomycetota bacterium]
MTNPDEERIALFVDFENLALGARDRREDLDMAVVMDALSERGRVVVRRAYADWNLFSEHRDSLLSQRIEMIEVPQRSGTIRKNAADIKLAVDALELAFQREFLTTFVIASGDSDFTPLVLKLRELNRRVIGVGVEGSTSQLLPGACDEFLFYERLLGPGTAKAAPHKPGRSGEGAQKSDIDGIARLVTGTLSGLQRSSDGPVLSSTIKRALLRKDATFTEGDYGFRAWGELMRHLAERGVITLQAGSAQGDPVVDFPSDGGGEQEAFDLLREVVGELEKRDDGGPPLSGLKDTLRRKQPGFSEKNYGYGGFLQFVKAAAAKGVIDLEWDEDAEEYYLYAPQ